MAGLLAIKELDRQKHPDPNPREEVADPYIRHAPALVPRTDISDIREEATHVHSLLHHIKDVEAPQIVEALVALTAKQRTEMLEVYESLYDQSLAGDLQDHDLLDGHPVIAGLVLPHVLYVAEELHRNIEDYLAILEILYTMTDPERRLSNDAYEKIFMLKFTSDLGHYYDGQVLRILASIAEGTHSDSFVVDKEQTAIDAKALFDAGQNEDVDVFADIFATRSHAQLLETIKLMSALFNTEIDDIVHFRLSGPVVPILLAIITLARCKELFYAKQVKKTIEAEIHPKRKLKNLLRIFLLRGEKDLVNVEKEFERLYATSIATAVQEIPEFSGTDKHSLILLLQGTPDKYRWDAHLEASKTGQLGIVADGRN